MTISEDSTSAQLSEAKEDIMRLWIEGVYINAAYIAAGFRGACQCPEYLKDHYRRLKVDSELPGVRYDVEAGNHRPLHPDHHAQGDHRLHQFHQRSNQP